MEEEQKKKLLRIERVVADIIIICLMGVGIYGLIYVGVHLRTDGAKCLKDPLVYYASLGNDTCWCEGGTVIERDTDGKIIKFRSREVRQTYQVDINFSEFLE